MNYGVVALVVFIVGAALTLLAGAGFMMELRFLAWEANVLFALYTVGVVLVAVSPSVYLYGRLNDLLSSGDSSG